MLRQGTKLKQDAEDYARLCLISVLHNMEYEITSPCCTITKYSVDAFKKLLVDAFCAGVKWKEENNEELKKK